MAKVKKGDVLSCEVCGLVMVVDEACGCAAADVLCCAKPMAKGKAAANKAKAVKAAKSPVKKAAKAVTKKAAPAKAVAKKPAKAVAKAKPAAKKPAKVKK
ncbi:MAG: hypothetical protein M0009_01455 [Deltaproteobacteria bacterium]|nr:hypothetical protein [Deltaproteobacteria bacterium]